MDLDDTKYCKDCAWYDRPHCTLPKTDFLYTTARKDTCDKWRATPTRAERKAAK